MQLNIHMKHLRSTKGTHFYTEVDSEGENTDIADSKGVQSLYIRKTAFEDQNNPPDRILVTITDE